MHLQLIVSIFFAKKRRQVWCHRPHLVHFIPYGVLTLICMHKPSPGPRSSNCVLVRDILDQQCHKKRVSWTGIAACTRMFLLAGVPGIARVILRLAAIPPTNAVSTLASCSTCVSRSTCALCSTWSWSCHDSKMTNLTCFAGSRDLCWPVTMHLAPSNLVAFLAPHLQGVRKFTFKNDEKQSLVLAFLWLKLPWPTGWRIHSCTQPKALTLTEGGPKHSPCHADSEYIWSQGSTSNGYRMKTGQKINFSFIYRTRYRCGK